MQLLLQNQNRTDVLGKILLDSISRNQSDAVAKAVRFALLPNTTALDQSRTPAYKKLAASIGAATAHAMQYARQEVSPQIL